MVAEALQIGSWTFGTDASVVEDFTPLWTPAGLRADTNAVIPGAAGVTPRPIVRGPIRFVLQAVIFGDKNAAGTPYADTRVGLKTNLDAFDAAVLAPVAASPFTRTMVHTLPDSSTRTAACQIVGVGDPIPRGAYTVELRLDVLIPTGTWS